MQRQVSIDPSRGEPANKPAVVDLLVDSFALLPGEAEWLIQLLGPDLGGLLDDET